MKYVIFYKNQNDWPDNPTWRDQDFVIFENAEDVVQWIIGNQYDKEIIYIVEVQV